MKIVFLDIDGVLNGSAWLGEGLPKIATPCVTNLNRLLKETGAKVVVSSTWRDKVLNGLMSMAGFAFLLRSHGIECDLEGITCSDMTVPGRNNQIRAWLSQNPKTTNYVVLDDVDAGFPGNRFIKTSAKSGLSSSDVDLAISILGRDENRKPEPPQERKLILP